MKSKLEECMVTFLEQKKENIMSKIKSNKSNKKKLKMFYHNYG